MFGTLGNRHRSVGGGGWYFVVFRVFRGDGTGEVEGGYQTPSKHRFPYFLPKTEHTDPPVAKRDAWSQAGVAKRDAWYIVLLSPPLYTCPKTRIH